MLWPGLPEHPGHEIAARQMRDFGGMVSFLVETEDEAVELVAHTTVWTLAESLGGVESLIEHPARMTHASTAAGPFAAPPNLVRLSVGLEAADDLVADLERALAAAPARAWHRSFWWETVSDTVLSRAERADFVPIAPPAGGGPRRHRSQTRAASLPTGW